MPRLSQSRALCDGPRPELPFREFAGYPGKFRHRQRFSAALAWVAVFAAAGAWFDWRFELVVLGALAGVVTLNAGFFRFLSERRSAWFALCAIPLFVMYLLYSSATFIAAVAAAAFDSSRGGALPERQS